MSPSSGSRKTRVSCFPRVSGDEPLNAVAGGNADTFSPRERG